MWHPTDLNLVLLLFNFWLRVERYFVPILNSAKLILPMQTDYGINSRIKNVVVINEEDIGFFILFLVICSLSLENKPWVPLPMDFRIQSDCDSCFWIARSDQLLSRVRLFATPWIAAHQASLSITNSRSSLRLCPSSQWCHPAISSSVVPFSSCPQSLPASVFSNESTLRMRWPKYWSFSFSIIPSKDCKRKYKTAYMVNFLLYSQCKQELSEIKNARLLWQVRNKKIYKIHITLSHLMGQLTFSLNWSMV